jgi:hypothetical protein
MTETNNTQFEMDGENSPEALALSQAAASLLKENSEALDMRTQARLEKARHAAVRHAEGVQHAHASGNVLQLASHYCSQHRAMTTMFAIMIATFFAVQLLGVNDNLEQSDAYLLAAELPPEAFADKGFNAWLVATHE